jgi:hypothetical protein
VVLRRNVVRRKEFSDYKVVVKRNQSEKKSEAGVDLQPVDETYLTDARKSPSKRFEIFLHYYYDVLPKDIQQINIILLCKDNR